MDEAPGLGRQPVEIVLSRDACLGQNGHEPVPDARPADGVEVGLTGDHEPGWDGEAA